MFQPGDIVFDSIAGTTVQVLDRIEAWGYV